MARKKTSRQQEIVDSARRIIIERGIDHLTVREIAAELKITNGALYRHFKSKNEILSLLIDDIEETLLTVIEAAAQRVDDPVQKLENVFFSHLSYAEQRRGVSFLVINKTMGIKNKVLQKKMFSVINQYLKMIKAILREGIAENKFRADINLGTAAIAFFGVIQSTVTIWGLSGYRYSLNKGNLQHTWDIYWRGIIAKA